MTILWTKCLDSSRMHNMYPPIGPIHPAAGSRQSSAVVVPGPVDNQL